MAKFVFQVLYTRHHRDFGVVRKGMFTTNSAGYAATVRSMKGVVELTKPTKPTAKANAKAKADAGAKAKADAGAKASEKSGAKS